jgi:hypothetical protein
MPACPAVQNLHPTFVTSKRRKWVFLLIGAAPAVLLIAYLTCEREPVYQRKPLSIWIEVYAGEYTNTMVKLPSGKMGDNAIRTIGTNALPYLLQWMRYEHQSRFSASSKSLVAKLPRFLTTARLQRWVKTDTATLRVEHAALAFGPLGEQAESAIPQLVAQLNDTAHPRLYHRASVALACIGTNAIPELLVRLANTDAPNHLAIARVFALVHIFHEDDFQVTSILVYSLQDSNPAVAKEAARALGITARQNQRPAGLVVSALTNCLNTASPPEVRRWALWALGEYGGRARDAVPALLHITSDPNNPSQVQASNALLQIAPEVLRNVPAQ